MIAERSRRNRPDGSGVLARHLNSVPDEPSGARKRGRRQGLADPEAGPVALLAHRLASLKLAAGDPSYDRMCRELGARASKSALSAAARGRDLPSWETTWEFVRCLAGPDQDLDALRTEWRARWEAARATEPDPVAAPSGPTPPGRSRRRAIGLVIGATVLIVLVAGGLELRAGGNDSDELPTGSVEQRPIPGDDSILVRDVTIPDGMVIEPGSVFEKTWEFRNKGTVRWKDRFLTRQPYSRGNCQSEGQVPIDPTEPGASVQVSVLVYAPVQPGTCTVYWKMTDQAGLPYLPHKNPPYYDVVIGR